MPRAITVVTVTHDAEEHVDRMLDSVRAALPHAPVIAVDNASSDGTAAKLRSREAVTVLEQTNSGYAHGLNRGIERATAQHDVLVLNPDVVLHRDVGLLLGRVLDDEPDVGIVVPSLQAPDGVGLPSLGREPTVWRMLVETVVGGSRAGRFGEAYRPPSDGRQVDVDWATGAAMLLRRRMVEQQGGFDESFFLYSEETEYCLRVRDAGWGVRCEPAAVVSHVGGALDRDPQLWALRAVNRVRLQRQRAGRFGGLAFRLASLGFEVRRVVIGSPSARVACRSLVRSDLDRAAVELAAELGADVAPMIRRD